MTAWVDNFSSGSDPTQAGLSERASIPQQSCGAPGLSAAGIQAVWDALLSALTTAGSIGKKLADLVFGTDNKSLISTDAQDLSATLDVNAKTVGDKTGYGLADDAITAAKFDQSTAHPLAQADTGATAVARVGADSDTLETLSDQLDGITAAAIADAVCDEALAGHTGAGSLAKAVSDILADTNELQTDWANGGRLDNLLDQAAALASVCTESRLSELDAANVPADVDALLTRLSADRAGYLDNLSAGAAALEASVATLNNISVADVLAVIIDGTGDKAISLGGVLKVLLAVLAGVSAGGGTGTNTYKDADGAAVVVSGNVDANGNRTSVTVTV